MVPGWDEDKGKQSARQRLGLVAKLLVNPAAALVAEKDAAVVAAMIEPIRPPPPRAMGCEEGNVLEIGFLVPSLRLDALPFLVREGDDVFLAAVAADVAVPVLQDR